MGEHRPSTLLTVFLVEKIVVVVVVYDVTFSLILSRVAPDTDLAGYFCRPAGYPGIRPAGYPVQP